MRTTKNSWLRTSTLFLLSLGIAYGAQSFTEKEDVSVKKATTTKWFAVDASGASNPATPDDDEQNVTAVLSSGTSAPCNQSSGELCARQVTYDESDTEIQDLIDRVEAGTNIPTMQEFKDAGATFGSTSHKL